MKNPFLIFLALLALAGPRAIAQTPEKDFELDTEHDSAANDPSDHEEVMSAPKLIPQKHLLLHRVTPEIGKNVDKSYRKAKREYRRNGGDEIFSDQSYLDLFQIHAHRYVPQKEFGPTTVNSNHEYRDYNISDREFGYCWGYATAVRYFTTLAFFDSSLPRTDDLSVYKSLMDQVMRGEATVFPGYAGLRELTLNPELEFYFKLNAMEAWRSRAVRRTSLSVFKHSSDAMNPKQIEDLLVDLETRISHGELPKIMFGAQHPDHLVLGMSADVHVVLAYKVERLGAGRARIHLWDINFYTETLQREPKWIEIDERGPSYGPWFEPNKPKDNDVLGLVRVAPENNLENAKMLRSLRSFCGKPENAKYCVKNSNY